MCLLQNPHNFLILWWQHWMLSQPYAIKKKSFPVKIVAQQCLHKTTVNTCFFLRWAFLFVLLRFACCFLLMNGVLCAGRGSLDVLLCVWWQCRWEYGIQVITLSGVCLFGGRFGWGGMCAGLRGFMKTFRVFLDSPPTSVFSTPFLLGPRIPIFLSSAVDVGIQISFIPLILSGFLSFF